jgi:DNA-directed RNA polymerase delta subunit
MDLAALRQRIPALLVELGEDAKTISLGEDAWVLHRGSTMG